MADAPRADDIRKEMEKQIADLKREVSQLGKSLSERTEAVYEELRGSAGGAYKAASRSADRASQQVRQQANVMSEVMRENPGTAATVLSSAGLLGFVLGILAGHLLSSNEQARSRWY